jgi:protein-S-isoprenylcysteine O-methyltransferase Ste14
MFSGDALITGTWRGVIAVAILFISFWFKLRKEEKWLLEIFGSKYQEYTSRTKKLIPWII